MKSPMKTLALAVLASAAFAMPAYAENDAVNPYAFVTMCEKDKDGMVSKAEVMKQVEKMFDKADTKKEGRLDKKQVEFFLQELMRSGA
jgi:hypothetical protein